MAPACADCRYRSRPPESRRAVRSRSSGTLRGQARQTYRETNRGTTGRAATTSITSATTSTRRTIAPTGTIARDWASGGIFRRWIGVTDVERRRLPMPVTACVAKPATTWVALVLCDTALHPRWMLCLFIGVLDDDGSANPDIRLMVEMAIVFGVIVAVLILWFTWLRHYVRRRSANRVQ